MRPGRALPIITYFKGSHPGPRLSRDAVPPALGHGKKGESASQYQVDLYHSCKLWSKLSVGKVNSHGHELPRKKQFSIADVNRHLEFDCARHLRLLARSGFLEMVPGREEKGLSECIRLETWPPRAAFFEGPPIGIAYYVQRWFRYGLQEWINQRMRELESKEGVYSLEWWHIDGRSPNPEATLPFPGGKERFGDRKGNNRAVKVSMIPVSGSI